MWPGPAKHTAGLLHGPPCTAATHSSQDGGTGRDSGKQLIGGIECGYIINGLFVIYIYLAFVIIPVVIASE